LRDAIRAPSFSSMYPDTDVQEFLESSFSSQQIVTPSQIGSPTNHGIIHNDIINIYSEEGLNNSNLSSSMVQECDDYKIVDTTVNKWFLSQPYYSSNVIMNETHRKIFRHHFVEFFDYLTSNNVLYPDLLKVQVDEFDNIQSYKYQLVCYTTNRTISSKVYEKFCEYDRDLIINILVTNASSYDSFYDDEETMEVMKVLNLGKYFCSFFESYKKLFFRGDNMIVIDDQNEDQTDNEQHNT
jgi:hypothetical protein